ncbi:hypothetical protein [Halorussus sp. MSC15.2]|uniref:hypothetical protein n=1 Tax=Halorussus sp. MSC15.2 TaxID=2283638 RepID=UPI0013D32FA1|nr:hypothetical protein [Halorussus sp. MSC15.2]NEU58272.1 hypothetical protein [Halorussus sp. MSC15.2]
MQERTQSDGGRSPLATLALLALTFAIGYVLGSQSGGESGEWQEVANEPTEITIDGEEEQTEE